jgi:hypothetical protein
MSALKQLLLSVLWDCLLVRVSVIRAAAISFRTRERDEVTKDMASYGSQFSINGMLDV